MKYPQVRDEHETLRRILAGASIARYGDGEFKLCKGASAVAQNYETGLSKRLRHILKDSGSCMVGIPAIHSDTPKRDFWSKYTYAAEWLDPSRTYASSFITRPDSAPWIDTNEYWSALESLWLGEDVTLVRGSAKGLTSEDMMGAGVIREIICPRQHSYAEYDSILQRIGTPKRAILCLGPTATVLAVDLCARGVHAIDLGHVALFIRKYRRGEPMTLSKDDKSQDKVTA
jgi:hypothetical protein